MPFVEIIKLHQLREGLRQRVRLQGLDYLLLHEQGRSYLLRDACPHAGALLSQGSLTDGVIRCARHGMSFDLATGQPLSQGCSRPLEFMPLSFSGNTLGVYL